MNKITNPTIRDLAKVGADLCDLIETRLVYGSPADIAARWLERRVHERIAEEHAQRMGVAS
jgi:hypothetical protein